jgi:hypothetical protein
MLRLDTHDRRCLAEECAGDTGQFAREMAFRQGQVAREEGKPQRANPYRGRGDGGGVHGEANAWDRGWEVMDRRLSRKGAA